MPCVIIRKMLITIVVCCVLFVTWGCSTTQKVAIKDHSSICHFIGSSCSKLKPGGKGHYSLRYVNSEANWRQYKKIMIDPFIYLGGNQTKISLVDQQTLVDFASAVSQEQLAKRFEMVHRPGPGVMRVQIVIMDAEEATPVLRTITMSVPQARALASLEYLSTGAYPFVGGAQFAVKVTDAMTGELLAAEADREIGGGSLKDAAQWKWGDAENAITIWTEKMTARLYGWTKGTEPF
jgi:hypothetical protein